MALKDLPNSMPRYCANLTFLFRELPFIERFGAASEAGFDAVEVLFPYDISVPEMQDALSIHGLTLALINAPPPSYTDGPRGFAAVPGLEDRFRHDFRRALRYAKALGARHLHLMAGTANGPEAEATYIDNLRWATAFAPDQSLTIEPINPADIEGYFLADFDLAARILDTVDAPNLHLQFDAYHAHRITGDVTATWEAHGARAMHIQVAGTPGRHEPLAGEIDYPAFFEMLDAVGYQGFVSGEYHPAGATADGLGWRI